MQKVKFPKWNAGLQIKKFLDRTYYLVRTSSDPAVIGVNNGIQQVEIHRSGFENKSMYDDIMKYWGSFNSWEHRNDYHGVNVELQCVNPLVGAKITSFLSYGPKLLQCPFLISQSVKDTFKKFLLPDVYFYKASVVTNEEKLNYYLFSCPDFGYSIVDFNKSIFFTGNELLGKKYVKLNDYSEFVEYGKAARCIVEMEKVVLSSKFNADLDLFVIEAGLLFISEALRNEIIDKKLDGLNILPAFGDSLKWPTICE